MNSHEKPLITFALFAYNQERFIREAVKGAFSQTYSPLEIVLSDDCSPDQTFEIMQEMAAAYSGPHTVILNRNEKNLGLIGHINKIMKTVKGELIVVAAGDDVSLPERTKKIYQVYLSSGRKAYSIFSLKSKIIDENSAVIGMETYNLQSNVSLDFKYFGQDLKWIPGYSHAWHKSIFEIFGSIDTDTISEDIVIPFRAALLGKVVAFPEPAVLRRHHLNNIGGPRSARSIKEKVDWYKQRNRSLIMNRIGISKTFLNDIKQAKKIQPQLYDHLTQLEFRTRKYLADQQMELQFINTNISGKILIIKSAIQQKTPILRIARWLFAKYTPFLFVKTASWFYQFKGRYIK